MVWPALSARTPAAWIAGPSAIGSVNGMPSSITSAPAFGSALAMASEVAVSGSPAMVKVTSAARPSAFSAAKRFSMRVRHFFLLARNAATESRSLSPRPERLTTIR